MKKLLLCGVAALALSACSTTQQANLNTTLANLNQTNLLALQAINNGCKIVQPTLVAASPASPDLAAAAGVNAVVCATAGVAANAASAVVAAQAPVAVSTAAPASAPAAASTPAAGAPQK
nr:hypothetical protein HUO10_003347 [Paraburkholderia busanensis]